MYRFLISCVIGLPLALSGAGCTSSVQGASNNAFGIKATDSDADKVAKYENRYNTIMRVLVYAEVQGWIPRDVANQIEVFRSAANGGLDQLKAQVVAGRPIDGTTEEAAVSAALGNLAIYELRYKNEPRPSAPVVQPPVIARPVQPLTRPATGR